MDLNFLWLVPVAYFIHIFEETPRFVPWAVKYLGAPKNFTEFVVGNVIFMVYVLISVSLAIFYPSIWTLVLGLSTAAWIFSNFLVHAFFTLRTGEYAPGVVTAGAIYVPVTLFVFFNVLGLGILNSFDIILAIIIGFAIMYVPTFMQAKRYGK